MNTRESLIDRLRRTGCACRVCTSGVGKKKLNIVSGFLGAGKTTMLNRLLAENGLGKIDVVLREYGAATIDDRLLNLDSSRLHMYLGISMHDNPQSMLYNFLERLYDESVRHPFDRLLLETSGAEGVENLVRMFYTGNMPAHYELESFITLVDAQFGLLNLEEFAVAREQVAFADKLVINRCDLASNDEIAGLRKALQSINPMAPIYETSYAAVPARKLLTAGGGLDVRTDAEVKGMGELESVTVTTALPLEFEKVNAWIHDLFSQYGDDILRAKGFFNIDGSDYRFEFQSVRTTFHSRTEERWSLGEERRSVIVLIGRNLPKADLLKSSLTDCHTEKEVSA